MYGTDAKVEIDRSFFRDNEPKPRSFLTRMLTNLKARAAGGCCMRLRSRVRLTVPPLALPQQVYFNDKQYESALLMIDYQRACAPDAAVAALNTRDRGICLYLSQRYGDAVVELEGYLEAYTEAVDREAITSAPLLLPLPLPLWLCRFATFVACVLCLTVLPTVPCLTAVIDMCRTAMAAERRLGAQPPPEDSGA
jgi:hypothetical protein